MELRFSPTFLVEPARMIGVFVQEFSIARISLKYMYGRIDF